MLGYANTNGNGGVGPTLAGGSGLPAGGMEDPGMPGVGHQQQVSQQQPTFTPSMTQQVKN